MLGSEQLMSTIDFHSIFFPTMEVSGAHQLFRSQHSESELLRVPTVMEFLEYHGILKGLFQTLKVREFYIFFVQVMEYQGFLFVNSIQCSCVLCEERAQTELSFSQRLSCAWMGKYIQKYKKYPWQVIL